VQEFVNDFQMNSQWIASVPIILFSIIAGALSDVFGRKPLIILPLIGNLVAIIFGIINYTFRYELPLEFFYFDKISAFFGGYAVYYLGMYSYGANVSKPKERAYRLARLDGAETIAVVVGTLISPKVFDWLGFYGNFGISGGVVILAILYHIFIVGEPMKNEETEKSQIEKSSLKFITKAFVTPILGMRDLLVKKRKPVLMFLIFLQFLWFCFYWLIIEIKFLLYLYMLLVFNISASDYATFNVVMNLCHAVCLMLVVPILSQKFKLHDAMLIFIILVTEVISFAATPFVDTLWQFYLVKLL
jgi:MFS family permease